MMKKLLFLIAFALTCNIGYSQEIKGIKLGMSRDAVKKLHPDGAEAMTIVGVTGLWSCELHTKDIPSACMSKVRYDNNIVVDIIFFTFETNFEHIKDAFVAKYPDMVCKDIYYPFPGRDIKQTECNFGSLSIRRLDNQLEPYTRVRLVDKDWLAAQDKEKLNKKEKSKKDI